MVWAPSPSTTCAPFRGSSPGPGPHQLAAWYGLGTACEQFGDLNTLRQAYEEWPLFSTFIDNIEMSLAKTDERIAKMYLALGDREDLNKKVLDEMELTRKWVLKIVGDEWPLQHRHVLGRAIRIRSPYVDALSVTQCSPSARYASAWTRKSSRTARRRTTPT